MLGDRRQIGGPVTHRSGAGGLGVGALLLAFPYLLNSQAPPLTPGHWLMRCHKCPVGGSMAPQVQPGPGVFLLPSKVPQTREGGRRLLETSAPGGGRQSSKF